MSTAYWNQWNGTEIMSMHGIELYDYYIDDHEDNNDHCSGCDEEESECCCLDALHREE
jgi:hypothetical protein